MAATGKMKRLAILGAAALLLVAVVGTLAFFKDKGEVVNTFTVGKVNIELNETVPANQTAKMVPGTEIAKDPCVTVKAGSVACWVFVQVAEENSAASFITYSPASGWTAGTGPTAEGGNGIPKNVWYREQAATSADVPIYVLAGDSATEALKNGKVHVKDTVTEEMLGALTSETYPTLSFKAYAIQKAKSGGQFTAPEAWAELSK